MGMVTLYRINSKQKEQYEEQLCARIRKYMAEDGQMEGAAGPLKFLKGLMVSNVAVTSTKRIYGTKRYWRLFNEMLFSRDEADIYFDDASNAEAFHSVMQDECMNYPREAVEKHGVPPVILLERLQDGMERAFIDYLQIDPFGEEAGRGKGMDREIENAEAMQAQKKEDAYVRLLYAASFYEIFLKEYGMELNRELQQMEDKGPDISRNGKYKEILEKIDRCTSTQERRQQMELLGEYLSQDLEHMYASTLYLFYIDYYISQQSYFYVMLRIIYLIEYVNINISIFDFEKTEILRDMMQKEKRGIHCTLQKEKRERTERMVEAQFWEIRARKWLEEGALFSEISYNKNRMNLYQELNSVFRNNSIFATLKGMDEEEFRKEAMENDILLWRYFEMLKEMGPLSKRRLSIHWKNMKQEFRELMLELSVPIWWAIGDILRIQGNVAERRAQNSAILKERKKEKQ